MLRIKSVPSLKRRGNFTNCLQKCHWQSCVAWRSNPQPFVNLIVQGDCFVENDERMKY